MRRFPRFLAALCTVLIAAGGLGGCGAGRSQGSSVLPASPQAKVLAAPRIAKDVLLANGDVAAIDSGGAASGSFSADTGYAATGTWTYKTASAIDTSAVTSPAPQAVYQSEREGSSIGYTVPGLTAGANYTVKLSFAELWWTAAGQRRFNVNVNGASVLTNFDVFAAAGAAKKAVVKTFTATATSAGSITIGFTSVTDNAAINAIEIIPISVATPTPAPTVAPTTAPGAVVAINSGGAATGTFSADTDVTSGGSWTYAVTNAINTSLVASPAPQAVYQSEREGPSLTYVIPGLSAGATYTVRLSFAELWWNAAGQRVFNVAINGTPVLTNFDVLATAGAARKAVTKSFTATAAAAGTITIAFTKVTDNVAVNAIEILSAGGSPTPTPAPTVSPVPFNDYPTFAYDNERDGFNPNTAAITPASVPNLHLAWQSALGGGDYNTQSQPLLATGIAGHTGLLLTGGGTGNVYAYDALSGALVWTRSTGQAAYTACGGTSYFGIGGSAAYDPATKSLYIVGNSNSALDAYAASTLYHIDAASGQVLGQVNFTPAAAGSTEFNLSHVSVTLNNGIAYVGTGSTCDISSWRGNVAAINVPAMTIANRFFTLWDPQNARGAGAQAWGGGSIWGWGGVTLDFAGNVLAGTGNADNGVTTQGTIAAPFVVAPQEYSGLAETLLELNPGVSSVVAANHPIATTMYNANANDLDVQGTPIVFQPSGAGCGPMVALQAKSGELTLYNESQINAGFAAQYAMGPSNYDDSYLGGPAYSPATGLLYADVASSTSPTLFAPGLVAINPGCGTPSVAWHTAFGTDSSAAGIPRSVPAATAGGVIIAGSVNGTGGAVWAINAATGTVLNGGNPVLLTSGNLRVPPTIDGNWIFILDNNGNMYGLTIDPSYKAIASKRRAADSRQRTKWMTRRS